MAVPFKAPEFKMEAKRQVEISFQGNVLAGVHLTLVKGPMNYPFKVLQVKMIFTPEANNQVRHYWLIDSSNVTSTTAVPPGTNLFEKEDPTLYFVGKAVVRVVHTDIEYEKPRRFIRCHTNNTSGLPYDVNCSIVIQEL